MMGMTTLLTLSSSFASLSTVTPPISYTTRLDVWMVTCIVFVFLTIAEFTLVIILKYYLVNHMPTFCFDRLLLGRNEIQPSQMLYSKEKELVVEDIADNGIGVSYSDLKENETSENWFYGNEISIIYAILIKNTVKTSFSRVIVYHNTFPQ